MAEASLTSYPSGAVIFYGVWKAQTIMMDSTKPPAPKREVALTIIPPADEFRNDPRNPAMRGGNMKSH